MRKASARLVDPRGSALVEGAVVMPWLLFLLLALIQFSLLLVTQVSVMTAAREGARAGALTGNEGLCQQVASQMLADSALVEGTASVRCRARSGVMEAEAVMRTPVIAPILQGVLKPVVTLRGVAHFRIEV